MPIKSGRYGRYYEWEDENKDTQKLSLTKANTYNLTEAQCDALVNGASVDIIKRNNKCDGFLEGKIKLERKTNKYGTSFWGTSFRTTNKIDDADKINKILTECIEQAENQPIDKLVDKINNKLANTELASEYKAFINISAQYSDINILYELLMYRDAHSMRIHPGTEFKYRKYLDTKNDIIIDNTPSQQKIDNYKDQAINYRNEKARIAAEEKKRQLVAEIVSKEWKQVTLEDYMRQSTADMKEDVINELEVLAEENCPDKDPKNITLFEIKCVEYTDLKPRNTMQNRSYSLYYIANTLKWVKREAIENYFAYPVASTSFKQKEAFKEIVEAVEKKEDLTIDYIISYTLHGTD